MKGKGPSQRLSVVQQAALFIERCLRREFNGAASWLFPAALALLVAGSTSANQAASSSAQVDFNRDVRRVLSENCFKCHGPDPKERKGAKKLGGLRLDTTDGARLDLGGYAAIVPGHPEKSELIKRITTNDPDDKMPPPKSGKKLQPNEIALLTKWVEQGAKYSLHWSLAKPTHPALPMVRNKRWPRNGIDYFILARLEQEGLQPSPEADRYAIGRRVSLDLVGLPPRTEEIDRFVHDGDTEAFERWVDRLLAKTAYGEHWARMWLDQARYADSTGYADDPARTIWGFRDYVVRALNANKPFDQFTLEQIAGDLLPDPTEEQMIATAFHRNTLTNNEGGTSDEEFRNVAIIDRVNTTMAVWMGTTMACAQCHNHKYDPFTQEEYFKLFAILNNTEDADRGDESPYFSVYTKQQKRQKAGWESDIARLGRIVTTSTPELAAAQTEWQKQFAADLDWQTLRPGKSVAKSGAAISAGPSPSPRPKEMVFPETSSAAQGRGRNEASLLETARQLDRSTAAIRSTAGFEPPLPRAADEVSGNTISFGRGEGEQSQSLAKSTPLEEGKLSTVSADEESVLHIARSNKTDTYTFEISLTTNTTITAVRLETLPDSSLPASGPGYF